MIEGLIFWGSVIGLVAGSGAILYGILTMLFTANNEEE